MVNIWMFDSTGAAYDACQYDDNIKTGDVLVIHSEQVVGIADTWPFAVTERFGKLHAVKGDIEDHIRDRNDWYVQHKFRTFIQEESVLLARSIKFHDSCWYVEQVDEDTEAKADPWQPINPLHPERF